MKPKHDERKLKEDLERELVTSLRVLAHLAGGGDRVADLVQRVVRVHGQPEGQQVLGDAGE